MQYSKLLATARSDLLLLSSYVRDMHNEIGNDSDIIRVATKWGAKLTKFMMIVSARSKI